MMGIKPKAAATLLVAALCGLALPAAAATPADGRDILARLLKGTPVECELAVIIRQQAEEADYNLSPSRWIGQNDSAEIGSIPALIEQLEQLNAQDLSLTADLLKLLRPLSNVEQAQ